MSKLELPRRWLAVVVLTGALAGCSGESTAPTGPVDQAAFVSHGGTSIAQTSRVRVPTNPSPIGVEPPCDNPYSERFCPVLP
jgi:hypothetical protein